MAYSLPPLPLLPAECHEEVEANVVVFGAAHHAQRRRAREV